MSDRDTAPDPIDEDYLRAEAMLADEDARAARRARVLAAAARQPAPAPILSPTPVRRYMWRGAGALMAASVAGLSLLVTLQQRPAPGERAQRSVPPNLPVPTVPRSAPAGARVQGPATAAPSDVVASATPRRSAPPPVATVPRQNPPPPVTDVPMIPPLPVPPVRQRTELIEIPPLPVPPVQQRIEVAPAPGAAPASPRAFPLGESAGAEGRVVASGSQAPDAVDRLGAAALAGRIEEVRSLLQAGVAVDAADAQGETALMKSIRGGSPAVARLLRSRGASLDRVNRAGESARALAAERQDPRIDSALGLER